MLAFASLSQSVSPARFSLNIAQFEGCLTIIPKMNVTPSLRKRELLLYFLLAYAVSWLLWLPLVLSQAGVGLIHTRLADPVSIFSGSVVFVPWLLAGSFGPVVAALVTQKLCSGNLRAFRLWTSFRQVILGAVVGMLCILFARWFLTAIVQTQSGFGAWDWASLLTFRYYFILSFIGGPIGEEPGWRGFALPRLQSHYGPVRASLFLGVLWAIWHLPLFLVHGWTTAPVWVYVAIITSLSIIMTFGYNLSGGSVIVAIVMHDTFNAAGAPLYYFLAKATLRQHHDLISVCALAATGAALIVLSRGRLGLHSTYTEARSTLAEELS
jgi:uncharacterized protein